MIKRCPKCGATTDDMYGFCIKCGYEFPKTENDENTCPLCQFSNPDEAEYCVKCGTPLIFKKQFENDSSLNPIIIKKEVINDANNYKETKKTSSWIILLGYIFSILGGILGLIIAIYLSTRKDPVAKKHGHIQLAIFVFYLILLLVLIVTGIMPTDMINQYQQMLSGNLTSFQR